MIKNIKKRSVSETEVTEKKAEETGKNKVFKKNKTGNKTVQNGQVNKQVKKNVSKNLKVETKKNKDLNATSKNDEKVKGKKRFRDKDSFSTDELKAKIQEITSRDQLSRTARRKLAFLKKLLRIKEGQSAESTQQPQKAKNAKSLEAEKNKQNKNLKGHLETNSKNQNKGMNIKQEKKDEDEDEDEDEEEDTELSEDENESDVEEEEGEEEDESEDEDEDEEEESEDDEDEDEDDENENEKIKTNNVQHKKGNTNEGEAKKKRYVIFVGNLPYNVTSEELKKHFLTKVSHVVNIRIPTKEDNSPRGFAYVEFANNTDFEKAFSLHHTMINGRRINVQYSGANKKEGVAKNFKLQALQKAGKFAGGKNRPFQKKFGNKGK